MMMMRTRTRTTTRTDEDVYCGDEVVMMITTVMVIQPLLPRYCIKKRDRERESSSSSSGTMATMIMGKKGGEEK